MPVWAAKLIAILVGFVVNFSLSHFVVFRPRERRALGPALTGNAQTRERRFELGVERIVGREHVFDLGDGDAVGALRCRKRASA